MSVTVISNLSNLIIRNCRICLSSLKDQECLQITDDICQLYMFCCDEVLTINKQHVICSTCLNKLKDFSEFKNKCHASKVYWYKDTRDELEYSKGVKNEPTEFCMDNYDNINVECKTEFSKRDVEDSGSHNDNPLCCNSCYKVFSLRSRLVKHVKACTRVKINTQKKLNTKQLDVKECGLCCISKSGIKDVSSHLREHYTDESLRCNLCEFKGIDFGDMLVHRLKHIENKQIICVCQQIFRSPAYLLYHFRKVHLGQSGVYCVTCNKDYKCLQAWRLHYRKIHSDKLECDYCGKKFLKCILIEHIRQIHLNITTCVCSICGAKFKKRSNLKLHEQAHVHAPSACGACGRVLKNPASLRAHQRRRHAPAPAPFVCVHCGKTFRRNSELRYHSLVHSTERRFRCDLCGAAFKQKSSVYLHRRQVHDKAVTHPCGECGKGFYNARALQRHRSVHTGVRPHACPHCPRTFHAAALVKEHVLNKHSKSSPAPVVSEGDYVEILIEPYDPSEPSQLTEPVEFQPRPSQRQYSKKNK